MNKTEFKRKAKKAYVITRVAALHTGHFIICSLTGMIAGSMASSNIKNPVGKGIIYFVTATPTMFALDDMLSKRREEITEELLDELDYI